MGTWRDKWQPIWLCRQDFVDATSSDMVVTCFDDIGDGTTESRGVRSVIARAEGRVLSFLVPVYGDPLPPQVLADMTNDPLLAGAALEYAIAFMFDKHPEYVRAKKQEDVAKRIEAADKQMIRILEARQRPPTVPDPPANVGGFSNDGANRLVTDDPGGPPGGNAGDY